LLRWSLVHSAESLHYSGCWLKRHCVNILFPNYPRFTGSKNGIPTIDRSRTRKFGSHIRSRRKCFIFGQKGLIKQQRCSTNTPTVLSSKTFNLLVHSCNVCDWKEAGIARQVLTLNTRNQSEAAGEGALPRRQVLADTDHSSHNLKSQSNLTSLASSSLIYCTSRYFREEQRPQKNKKICPIKSMHSSCFHREKWNPGRKDLAWRWNFSKLCIFLI